MVSAHLLRFSCRRFATFKVSSFKYLNKVFRSKKNPAGMAQQFGGIVWENDVHKARTEERRCVHLGDRD